MHLKNQLDACQSGQGAQAEAVEGSDSLPSSLPPSLPSSFPTARAKAAEEKFSKLREVYGKLRNEHISLLRSSAETQKKLAVTEQSVQEGEKKRVVSGREGGREKRRESRRKGRGREGVRGGEGWRKGGREDQRGYGTVHLYLWYILSCHMIVM